MKVQDRLHDHYEHEQNLLQQMKETVRNEGEQRDLNTQMNIEELSDIEEGMKKFLLSVGYY